MEKDRESVKKKKELLHVQKKCETDKIIALAGNPNVGKSTVFNTLTGMKQHTGNWPGKTVTNAQGYCTNGGLGYVLVDLPGCYSLMAHSEEEAAARDFICFARPDAVVMICDATCLERNLNLVLQVLETGQKVVVCINLMDEAAKKHIRVELEHIEKALGVPVIGMAARSGQGLEQLFTALKKIENKKNKENKEKSRIEYPEAVEIAINRMEPAVTMVFGEKSYARWLSLRLLEGDEELLHAFSEYYGANAMDHGVLTDTVAAAKKELAAKGFSKDTLRDAIMESIIHRAEDISRNAVCFEKPSCQAMDRKMDKIFTSRLTGFPVMLLLLLGIFWLTMAGANIPSRLLSNALFGLEPLLVSFADKIRLPAFISTPLIYGVYRVLAWVISVMLPPMAIFFPLFTLLEDFGYLPRVAFNLDCCFKKCSACGKQALTMCMGFGCNAAGVTGCRIIDSPRERLIAIITNNFVPCNGRFPALISIISMFLIGSGFGLFSSVLSAALLAGVIVLGICMTFVTSALLSKTILKGVPSSFTLELPPYRRPQIGKVIVRSVFDRTLCVLQRAMAAAAPAGLVIWLFANIPAGDGTVLSQCAGFLDPFARLIGLDGMILLAFILGMPANEIVVPIMIMGYMAQGTLTDIGDTELIRQLLVENGWTWITAVNMVLFTLMHWPCATTCLTIRKETQSIKWTAAAFFVPTAAGLILCFIFTSIARLITGI